MVRRYVWSRNLVNEEALAHWGAHFLQNTDIYFPDYSEA